MKRLALALAGLILLTTAAACGTGNPVSDTPTTQTPAQSSPSVTGSDPVTLTWFVFGKKFKDSQAVLDEYNRQLAEILPNTVVNLEMVEEPEYKQRFDLKMAANENVDLSWTGYQFSYFTEVQRGSYLPLTSLFEQYGKDMAAEIPEYMFGKQTINGELYSIPHYQQAWFRGNSIKIPKDLADEYGDIENIGLVHRSNMYTSQECYDVLTSFLDKLNAAGKVQLGISNQTVAWLADKGMECINGERSPYAIRYFDEDLTVYLKYELDEYKDLYRTFADWYQKGYIRKDILSIQNPRSEDGKPGGTVMWVHGYLQNQSTLDTRAYGFPVLCDPLDGYKYITFDTFNTASVVPRTSQNPERAMQLLNVMNSRIGRDIFRLLGRGFEGEHYTVSDGVVEVIRDADNNPLYEIVPWVLASPINDYETSKGIMQITKDYNENALVSPLTGFKADTSAVLSEWAQVDAVVTEYHGMLITGAIADWESHYNEFIDKIKMAGADAIVAELQRQVNEFKAANPAGVKARTDTMQQSWEQHQARDDKFLYDGYYKDDKVNP